MIINTLNKILEYSFYGLFFFVPLALTPLNYELFEYNKMMLIYAITAIIVGAWVGKMIWNQKILLRPTPFDIPIALFFASQVISYFYSIDRHVSFWGYYSRFHGGLLSTIAYILLYYAFVSNFKKEHISRLIGIALGSGILISFYGILEHFSHSPSCLFFTGKFDVSCWVQDVENRVFATLGQPNWLAAYLAILIPIALYQSMKKLQTPNSKLQTIAAFFLPIIFYVTLLFTKSRSGFIASLVTQGLFWLVLFYRSKEKIKKPFVIFNVFLIVLTIIISTPFEQINRVMYSFAPLQIIRKTLHPQAEIPLSQIAGPALETGGTESGEIRRIVWKGALDIAKHYPLFGTGVETFAFAYYQYRPVEHNLTSEWDFLYNKAHNEFLNYLAIVLNGGEHKFQILEEGV